MWSLSAVFKVHLECYNCFSYECDTQTLHLSVFSGLKGAHLVFLFLRESLERTRLKFSVQGGKVTALCFQEGEQVWALNIKRALLSMLQTSRTASKQELEKEVRVDEAMEMKHLNKCNNYFL